MGWGSKLWSAAKNVYRKTVETVSEIVTTVKEKCSKAWGAVTGKTTFEKAEKLYAEITEKYDKAKFEYEKAVKEISDDIKDKVSTINSFKADIYNIQFKRFTTMANRLTNVTVKGQPFEELFDDGILEVKKKTGGRNKNELFLIDFNNMSFIAAAGHILTLGIFSRKAAKQSLLQVQEEEKRIDEEIIKMTAHKKQLKVVATSIDTVVEYFNVLIKNYSKLLDRFEYGIQTQRFKQQSNSDHLFTLKLDFRLIPIVHIEEFQALFNLSIVLKEMAILGYISDTGEVVKNDKSAAEKLFKKTESIQVLAA
ncbi:DNA repair protein [Pseudoalteromonas sp. SG44-5]|uniref:DNA repair protein n=1 Tax=unclassified Pseudoalteromonas TaxID=194690 RepID=UPI0015FAE93D|nr:MULTISPECIES: DNA repair protein [unclassified Pseudoalteromonas]MBB1406102.1 DNA repair protein [Pseudoalteromonas sp. SG44-5]MBH0093688.1 DNA repair protein [Pseudoalteromonas sp. SCQQ13]